MNYEVKLGDRVASVDVRRQGDGWVVSVDGGPARVVTGRPQGTTAWRLDAGDGLRRTLDVALRGEQAFVLDGATPLRGEVVDPRDHALELGGGAGAGRVTTQMPGAVVRVLVAVGAQVHPGQVLVVVEAMKMENEFKAPFAGLVVSVDVQPGQAVESGALLMVLEEAAS